MTALLRYLLPWLRRLAVGAAVVLATVYLVRALDSRNMLPLKAEHKVQFIEEFRASQEADTDWAGYLAIEEHLEAATREKVGSRDSGSDILDRYGRGSPSNPNNHSPNWNRSYLLPAEPPRGTVVLVHGLTDSPYSVRATAVLLQELRLSAYAPRMPGHGFAVGDLRYTTWEDWLEPQKAAAIPDE